MSTKAPPVLCSVGVQGKRGRKAQEYPQEAISRTQSPGFRAKNGKAGDNLSRFRSGREGEAGVGKGLPEPKPCRKCFWWEHPPVRRGPSSAETSQTSMERAERSTTVPTETIRTPDPCAGWGSAGHPPARPWPSEEAGDLCSESPEASSKEEQSMPQRRFSAGTGSELRALIPRACWAAEHIPPRVGTLGLGTEQSPGRLAGSGCETAGAFCRRCQGGCPPSVPPDPRNGTEEPFTCCCVSHRAGAASLSSGRSPGGSRGWRSPAGSRGLPALAQAPLTRLKREPEGNDLAAHRARSGCGER